MAYVIKRWLPKWGRGGPAKGFFFNGCITCTGARRWTEDREKGKTYATKTAAWKDARKIGSFPEEIVKIRNPKYRSK